ncbi:hypothetical protein BDK51DRAFT_34344 [Blyttiomyces helicus]|uniref:Uncharacterized protein n=1 Tax=Blyttiomyces helicus TaxID=388810 RepID=A0A4P9WM92_9FUNG|nr:hypothetical protein BDK51DRAFT_34344 [Blyttiomyces helicus]|eukprot:RKO93325.1 hypothetical protein BDK51DRAFT_34344 [Blyttiomyces helicus]
MPLSHVLKLCTPNCWPSNPIHRPRHSVVLWWKSSVSPPPPRRVHPPRDGYDASKVFMMLPLSKGCMDMGLSRNEQRSAVTDAKEIAGNHAEEGSIGEEAEARGRTNIGGLIVMPFGAPRCAVLLQKQSSFAKQAPPTSRGFGGECFRAF